MRTMAPARQADYLPVRLPPSSRSRRRCPCGTDLLPSSRAAAAVSREGRSPVPTSSPCRQARRGSASLLRRQASPSDLEPVPALPGAVGLEHRIWPFHARCHVVLQTCGCKRPAQRHLMTSSTEAIGLEIGWRDAARFEVNACRTFRRNRIVWRKMIGSDHVAQYRKRAHSLQLTR